MKLYLDDIQKAVSSMPNTSKDTPKGEMAVQQYEESYLKEPAGAASGEALDNSEEADEEETKKSESTEMLKSLTVEMRRRFTCTPSDREIEFLIEQGHDPEMVVKGLVPIRGKDRDLFTRWLCDRLDKSISKLIGR